MKGKHIGKNAVKRKKTPLGCLLELGYSRKARRCSRLPLMSKLNALCGSNANPHSQSEQCSRPTDCAKRKMQSHRMVQLHFLAQREGFEPSCAFGTNWFRVSPVMTASIPLHKYDAIVCIIFMQSPLRRGSMSTAHWIRFATFGRRPKYLCWCNYIHF